MKVRVTTTTELDLDDLARDMSRLDIDNLEGFLVVLDEYVEDPNFTKKIANRFMQIVEDRRINAES